MRQLNTDIIDKLKELTNDINEYLENPRRFDNKRCYKNDSDNPSLTLWTLINDFMLFVLNNYPVKNINGSYNQRNIEIQEIISFENLEITSLDTVIVTLNKIKKFIKNIEDNIVTKIWE